MVWPLFNKHYRKEYGFLLNAVNSGMGDGESSTSETESTSSSDAGGGGNPVVVIQ